MLVIGGLVVVMILPLFKPRTFPHLVRLDCRAIVPSAEEAYQVCTKRPWSDTRLITC